jgi:hypothetical protein
MSTDRALRFKVLPNQELPVRVTICSGPNIDAPYDLGVETTDETGFSGYVALPLVQAIGQGDTYRALAEYADGSREWCSMSVTNVVEQTLTPIAPAGAVAAVTPEFSWTVSAAMPTTYVQSLWVYGGGERIWEIENLESSRRSVIYDSDGKARSSGLEKGSNYVWGVRIRDADGNTSTLESVPFAIAP